MTTVIFLQDLSPELKVFLSLYSSDIDHREHLRSKCNSKLQTSWGKDR